MKIKTRFVILFALVLDVISVVVIGAPVHAKPMSAIFAVNDTTDLVDDNLVDGVCHTTSNTCTLRAAVMQTNASGGTNTINLPAGTFVLTIVGPDPNDDGAAMDLNIKNNLTINGAGVDNTIIDGNGTDRVFNISGAQQVSIVNVTIRNGLGILNGGGIYSFSGNLTVTVGLHSIVERVLATESHRNTRKISVKFCVVLWQI